MATFHHGQHTGVLRASHVAWALVALVFVIVGGTTLLSAMGPTARHTAQVSLNMDESLMRVEPDAFDAGAIPALEAPMVADGVGDDRVHALGEESEARPLIDDAMIVRTALLDLEVADVAAVLRDARREVAALGGYVAGSDEYDEGERRWASVTYRVPVDRFEEAIDALRDLSTRVVRESTQSSEVTAVVVDLDARITNLRASEGALVEIMDRAGRIEDVLAVQMRLEDVRGQIERLVAQRARLADQAARSTLAVSWFTSIAAVTVAQQGWDLGAELDSALAQTVQVLQELASISVWVAVVAVPLLGLPALALLLVGTLLLRRIRRHPDIPTPTL